MTDLTQLAKDLRSEDVITRQLARKTLERAGEGSAAVFLKALEEEEHQTRWEGAKGLSKLGDPETGEALVKLLQDDDHGIRWLAAEGLLKIGAPALKPLLNELSHSPSSTEGLYEGAHHVLHDLEATTEVQEAVAPVLEALSGGYPTRLSLPAAALTALNDLD